MDQLSEIGFLLEMGWIQVKQDFSSIFDDFRRRNFSALHFLKKILTFDMSQDNSETIIHRNVFAVFFIKNAIW